MQNFIQPGAVLTLTMPYDRLSGQGVKVGRFFGVCSTDALNTTTCEVMVEGVFNLAKAAGAWTQGDLLYWDDSAKNVTETASGNMLIGVAVRGQLSGDTTGWVRLNEAASNLSAGHATIAALTDNSGGATADGTIGVCTLPTLASWDTAHDPTAAEATQIITFCTEARDAIKELATKVNAIVAALA